jgi:hypothetical protein
MEERHNPTKAGAYIMKNRYITAYAVTRHFGGPEEGGWWYNWYKVIESIRVPKMYQRETSKRSMKAVKKREKALQLKLEGINEGNIYHVSGGVLVVTCIEAARHENETTERPYYC